MCVVKFLIHIRIKVMLIKCVCIWMCITTACCLLPFHFCVAFKFHLYLELFKWFDKIIKHIRFNYISLIIKQFVVTAFNCLLRFISNEVHRYKHTQSNMIFMMPVCEQNNVFYVHDSVQRIKAQTSCLNVFNEIPSYLYINT